MNGGIIDRAERGTKAYSDAEIQEQLKLAYQEYQMAKYSETGYTLQNALAKTGLDIAGVEGNDSTGYEVKVNTRDGEKSYVLQANGSVGVASTEWTYDGHGTYTKGIKQYKVGDKVNYNEGTGYSFTTDTTKGMGSSATYNNETNKYDLTAGTYTTLDLSWRILGVNSEGQVELINDSLTNSVYMANEEAYLNGPEELDKMCNALYGKGAGALSARNLKIEDINKLANYDSTNNTYTKYRITSEGNYAFSNSTDGATNWSDWQTVASYYGVNTFTMLGSNNTLSASNPGETEAIKNTGYEYNVLERITSTISEDVANFMLEKNGNGNWVSSSCVTCGFLTANWNLFKLGSRSNGNVDVVKMYSSEGKMFGLPYSIRPVVTLSSNVQLNWNSSLNQWEIQQ